MAKRVGLILRVPMNSEITWCQWIPKTEPERIAEYERDGWEVREVFCHHGHHAVLAVRYETDVSDL